MVCAFFIGGFSVIGIIRSAWYDDLDDLAHIPKTASSWQWFVTGIVFIMFLLLTAMSIGQGPQTLSFRTTATYIFITLGINLLVCVACTIANAKHHRLIAMMIAMFTFMINLALSVFRLTDPSFFQPVVALFFG